MRYYKIFLVCIAIVFLCGFVNRPAYKIYTKKGKHISLSDLSKELSSSDVVLFGELHNVSIVHWLQLEILKDLSKSKQRQLIVGAEFMESDNQIVVDEFISGLISLTHLKNESKIWNNFETDHAPLLADCRKYNVPFVATNIPRRYANIVAREGVSKLGDMSKDALAYIVPLPFEINKELQTYKPLGEMQHHSMPYMIEAQAIKDATMAHFITKNFSEGKLIYHINGSYHSDYYEGIYWYLKQTRPNLKITTISCVETENLEVVDKSLYEKADYIIAVPSNMTKTY